MSKKHQQEWRPKEEHRNLRLWAEGARETILAAHLDNFSAARMKGSHAEKAYLQKVCNEFHDRVDWRLADHEEPILKPWSSDTIISKETLPDDEEKKKCARIEELNAIHRWFTYRIHRLLKHRCMGLNPSKDPYTILLGKLSGLSSPPKAQQAYQHGIEEVGRKVRARVRPSAKGTKAGFRAEVACQVFAALPTTERAEFAKRAKEDAEKAKTEYLTTLKRPASTAPADRQKCIDGAGDFLAPILRGLSECTGLHMVLLMGGPMPKYGGELRTKQHERRTDSAHFPQWDKNRFNENILKFMIEYLATAYTKEECSAAALPDVLAQAAYTIKASDTGDDDRQLLADGEDFDSGSDSDSDSEDSDSETDDEGPQRKKAKVTHQPTLRQERPQHPPLSSAPHPSPRLSPSVPSTSPLPPPQDSGYGGYSVTPAQRDAIITRNWADMLALNAQFKEIMDAPLGKPKPVRKKKEKAVPGPATRKSTRVAGLAAPAVSEEAPSTSIAPSTPAITPSTTAVSDTSIVAPAVTLDIPVTSMPKSFGFPSEVLRNLRSLENLRQGFLRNEAQHLTTPILDTPILPIALTPVPPIVDHPSDDQMEHTPADTADGQMGQLTHALPPPLTASAPMAASRFEHVDTNLPHKGRLVQVSRWIASQRGRRVADMAVPDPVVYAKEWQTWWDGLQPKWRVRGGDSRWTVGGIYGTEWEDLFQWGVNGVLSLLVALYFWGCAIIGSTNEGHQLSWPVILKI
ncbi:hypothetical protein C8J57DRAFT_1259102 [Mycena rebaudengoi]|nr:hypothetical protein C8J57DRAFT_1259102 [Mycena rebaudengoi]